MIKRPLQALLAFFLVLAWTAAPAALAQNAQLSIRLVRAGQGGEVDPGLRDVAALMKGNLAFSSFKLLESASVGLPASGSVRMGQYKVALSGPAAALDIHVTRGGSSVIKTRAVLRGGSPLVLGGIPSREGTLLFVLKLAD